VLRIAEQYVSLAVLLATLLRGAMHVKPERHHLALGETASAMRAFSEIGG